MKIKLGSKRGWICGFWSQCAALSLTFMLLLHSQVDLVDAGLNIVPGQIVAARLSGRGLQTHQLIHVSEEHTGAAPWLNLLQKDAKKNSPTAAACAHLCAYSSSTLLSPATVLDSCLQRAARSPTSSAWFISTTDDSISTATSSSGWDSEPCETGHKFTSYVRAADYQGQTACWFVVPIRGDEFRLEHLTAAQAMRRQSGVSISGDNWLLGFVILCLFSKTLLIFHKLLKCDYCGC